MKKRRIKDYIFSHLTLILLLHYLVKYRSRSLAVYNNEFMLGIAHASAQTRGQNQWDVQSQHSCEKAAASWHSCSIWKRVFRFLARQCPITSIAPKTHTVVRCWIKRRPILSHPLSGRLTYTEPQPGWLHRVECASGESVSYQDLGCRRTETTHQQRVGRSKSHGYWMCCCRVSSGVGI